MHPITSQFLTDDRIADLHRDAERRRLVSTPARPPRGTVHRPPPASRPMFGRTAD